MTEENNKPKATLIKHVVTPSGQKEENKSPAKEQDTKPKVTEKRRVVVVKRKWLWSSPNPRVTLSRVNRKVLLKHPKWMKVPSLMKNKAPSNASVVCAELSVLLQTSFPLPLCIMVRL